MARRIKGGTAVGADAPRRAQRLGPVGRASWFEVSAVAETKRVVAEASSGIVTVQDRVVFRQVGTTMATDFTVPVTILPRAGMVPPTAQLATTGGALVQNPSEPLNVRSMSHGVAGTLTVANPSRAVAVPLTSKVVVEGGTTDTWQSWVAGTLAQHCDAAVDTRLAEKNPATALRIFTSQNHSTGVFVRNPDVWCADLVQALTCMSPSNSSGGPRRAGTLLTRRHILLAAHYGLDVGGLGGWFRFVTAAGATVTRNVVGYGRTVPGTDFIVYLLDSDVPETITPCKVLPTDAESYVPGIRTHPYSAQPPGIGGLCLDQEEKALVSNLAWIENSASFIRPPAAQTQRLAFYEDKISGDSGNPAFLIVNGELVLCTVWTGGGGGGGSDVSDHLAGLNLAISQVDAAASISTGYTVTPADFSGFPSWP